jgi:hypothetical protein
LAWIDNSTNEDGFNIERSTNGGNYNSPRDGSERASPIIPTPDSPPEPLIFIACRRSVRAGAIPPIPAPSSAATLLPPAPVTPVGLVAVPGNGKINLSWLASPGANSYNLKRSTSSGGETNLISTASTAYTDSSTRQRHDLLLRRFGGEWRR